MVALRYARRAVALLEASDDTLHLARAHLLCGYILNDKGDAGRASEHLTRAEELLGTRPESPDLASLRTEQARAAAALGRGAQAVVLAREALEVLGPSDPGERGEALWALALGLELERDLHGADGTFREAVELLHANHRWRDVRLASQAWADLLRRAGRESDADAIVARYAEAGRAQAAER
jgi:tetratricopeptide (TPR) repeat protein